MSKFQIGDEVRRVKSGKVYVIAAEPQQNRLEATNTPAYRYRLANPICAEDFISWNRAQDEMEDGRFEIIG